ncbi:MAG: BamA/TamA family outer membrane protein [candidate division Zixibacteria bacterium]|nr:BamA/TamA family outer membrane protein [candidate division Zixibacteria bacterium]
MKTFLILLMAVLVLSIFPADSMAQYKDYQKQNSKAAYFSVSINNQTGWLLLTVYGEKTASFKVPITDIQISAERAELAADISFESEGLSYQGTIYKYDEISATDIRESADSVTIMFYEISGSSSKLSRTRRGNIFSFSKTITVEHDAFVRGAVLSILGDININGEVNKDIISLFGNINLTKGAVARGDIASVTGVIEIEEQASIYGEVYSGTEEIDSRRFKFYRGHEFTQGLMLNYNRVDGLLLGGKFGFEHKDSLTPAVDAGFGYAFEAKRIRYFFAAEQYIWKKQLLRIGGSFYRKLSSEDDWLLGNSENTVFALIAREDFKDYYESEGASGWIKMSAAKDLLLTISYDSYDSRWIKSQKNLWSMFGGSKLFRENFSSIEPSYRAVGIAEIDSKHNAEVSLEFSYDNRLNDDDNILSGWKFSGNFQWSADRFSSDFDYRKYTFQIIRYQKVNRISAIRLRAVHGNSDGNLPMYKRYFLGGLGTLPGYNHKEMIGSRFWMLNSEYRVGLTKKHFSYLLFMWDVGQIANDSRLDDQSEIKHSLGLGLDFSGLRVNFSKRLDGQADRNIKIHVRFSSSF